MNWAQFKDPLCYLCLADAVVVYWSLTQEMAGSNNLFKMTILFVAEFNVIQLKHLGKTQLI